jgi:outer membrane murein-binding lipoprotein Lpp
LKRSSILIVILLVLSIAGCATQDDVNIIKMNVYALQKDFSELEKTIQVDKESGKAVRKNQADIGADIIDLRQKIQELRGITEELEVKTEHLKTGYSGEKLKELSDDVDDVEVRVARK